MKKGLVLSVALLATMTLASCKNEVNFINKLPYKEKMEEAERKELIEKIYDGLDGLVKVEVDYETYTCTTTEKSTVKEHKNYTYYDGQYCELEYYKETNSNYDGGEKKSKESHKSYDYLEESSRSLYESQTGYYSYVRITSMEYSTYKSYLDNFYITEVSKTSISQSKAYKNGNGYALVYTDANNTSKTQFVLEVDSNYHITKETQYVENQSFIDTMHKRFDEMTLIYKLTKYVKFTYGEKPNKPSNYMDHFKEEK